MPYLLKKLSLSEGDWQMQRSSLLPVPVLEAGTLHHRGHCDKPSDPGPGSPGDRPRVWGLGFGV